MLNKIEYLGDGVYVKFDGYHIQLLANDPYNPTDRIYIEPEVLTVFTSYISKLKLFITQSKSD